MHDISYCIRRLIFLETIALSSGTFATNDDKLLSMKTPTNSIARKINKFIIIGASRYILSISINRFPVSYSATLFLLVIFKRIHSRSDRFISSTIVTRGECRGTWKQSTPYRPLVNILYRSRASYATEIRRYRLVVSFVLWGREIELVGLDPPGGGVLSGEQKLLFETRGCLSKNILIGSTSVEILPNYLMRLNMFNELSTEIFAQVSEKFTNFTNKFTNSNFVEVIY